MSAKPSPVCAVCGAPHGKYIARGAYNGREAYMVVETSHVFCADTGLFMARVKRSDFAARSVMMNYLAVMTFTEGRKRLCPLHRSMMVARSRPKPAARRRRAGQLELEDFL